MQKISGIGYFRSERRLYACMTMQSLPFKEENNEKKKDNTRVCHIRLAMNYYDKDILLMHVASVL